MVTLDQAIRKQENQVRYDWMPACGGTEKPFMYHGYKVQYMWNRTTGKHAYYRFEHDMFYVNMDCKEVAE